MKQLRTLLLILLLPLGLFAQDECTSSTAITYLHGNEIRAAINNNGAIFNEGGGDGAFLVPYNGALTPTTIFTSGLWMGGLDPGGNLKLTSTTYTSGGEGLAAGPYDAELGADLESCSNWDRVFTVHNYDIFAHLDDFNDNGTVDSPIEAIYGWPGRGNPYFFDIYGFELPDLIYGLAPFFDQNGNGMYDPDQGDYPFIPQSEAIPAQITFSIFNDASNLPEFGANPLSLEVHLTTWSYFCQGDDPLDRTLFTSHKLISKAFEPVDSTVVGFFIDSDLGCFTDDYAGTAPDINTVYSYNADLIDGENGTNCQAGILTYGENPPVQAVTVLNHELYKSMTFNNSGVGNPNPGTTDPQQGIEAYRYLNGEWRDGTPLTEGGTGYNPGGGTPSDYIFSGDPNNPGEWSMLDENLIPLDSRQLFSVEVGTWQPGAIFELDLAWSFHQDENLDHIQTINLMKDNVEEIQEDYDNQFQNACILAPVCTIDCVWSGDTNNDGIANHEDLLPIGTAQGATGPIRDGLINWAPYTGLDWSANLPGGFNAKHIDANADGDVTQTDIAQIELHYGLITPSYEMPDPVYPEGPELYWEPALTTSSFDNLEGGQNVFARLLANPTPDLYGVAFTIELDEDYFSNLSIFLIGDCDGDCWIVDKEQITPSIPGTLEYDIAITKNQGAGDLADFLEVLVSTTLQAEFNDPLPSNTTGFRLRNLRGIDASGNDLTIGATEPILTIPEITVVNSTTETAIDASTISIFPNPNPGRFQAKSELYPIEAWALYSIDGVRITGGMAQNAFQQAVNIPNATPGVYLLEVRTAAGRSMHKIVCE